MGFILLQIIKTFIVKSVVLKPALYNVTEDMWRLFYRYYAHLNTFVQSYDIASEALNYGKP